MQTYFLKIFLDNVKFAVLFFAITSIVGASAGFIILFYQHFAIIRFFINVLIIIIIISALLAALETYNKRDAL